MHTTQQQFQLYTTEIPIRVNPILMQNQCSSVEGVGGREVYTFVTFGEPSKRIPASKVADAIKDLNSSDCIVQDRQPTSYTNWKLTDKPARIDRSRKLPVCSFLGQDERNIRLECLYKYSVLTDSLLNLDLYSFLQLLICRFVGKLAVIIINFAAIINI